MTSIEARRLTGRGRSLETVWPGEGPAHRVRVRTRHRAVLVDLLRLARGSVLVAVDSVLVEGLRVGLGVAVGLPKLVLVGGGRAGVGLLLEAVLLPDRVGVGVGVGQGQVAVFVKVRRLALGGVFASGRVRRLEALLHGVGRTQLSGRSVGGDVSGGTPSGVLVERSVLVLNRLGLGIGARALLEAVVHVLGGSLGVSLGDTIRGMVHDLGTARDGESIFVVIREVDGVGIATTTTS